MYENILLYYENIMISAGGGRQGAATATKGFKRYRVVFYITGDFSVKQRP